eukprot:6192532-Pleurochrysis_carterae.AAC.1
MRARRKNTFSAGRFVGLFRSSRDCKKTIPVLVLENSDLELALLYAPASALEFIETPADRRAAGRRKRSAAKCAQTSRAPASSPRRRENDHVCAECSYPEV